MFSYAYANETIFSLIPSKQNCLEPLFPNILKTIPVSHCHTSLRKKHNRSDDRIQYIPVYVLTSFIDCRDSHLCFHYIGKRTNQFFFVFFSYDFSLLFIYFFLNMCVLKRCTRHIVSSNKKLIRILQWQRILCFLIFS